MAFIHNNVQVQTTPTLIAKIEPTSRYTAVSIQNTHSAAIFVGDANVTTSGATIGHSVAANATYQVWVNAGDKIYAVAAAQTAAGAISVIYSA
jgi:uncharacterized protein with beta-barrel porin domain